MHRDDKAHTVLSPYVVKKKKFGMHNYLLDSNKTNCPERTVFKYFQFPVFDISKIEMNKISKNNNWDDIMHMTWFCHNPKNDQTPCGRCNPCIYTIEEGLGWRMPLSSRVEGLLIRKCTMPIKKMSLIFFLHIFMSPNINI